MARNSTNGFYIHCEGFTSMIGLDSGDVSRGGSGGVSVCGLYGLSIHNGIVYVVNENMIRNRHRPWRKGTSLRNPKRYSQPRLAPRHECTVTDNTNSQYRRCFIRLCF